MARLTSIIPLLAILALSGNLHQVAEAADCPDLLIESNLKNMIHGKLQWMALSQIRPNPNTSKDSLPPSKLVMRQILDADILAVKSARARQKPKIDDVLVF